MENIGWSVYTTELCGILKYHCTDKAACDENKDHNYSRLYSRLFHDLRYHPIRYFEVGIGTINPQIRSNMAHMVDQINYKPGASLRGFKEFFPEGEIYGADFDKTILFQEDRIHTFYVDQTDPESIKDLWTQIDGEFDIMIDDALHTFEANKTFFLNSVHKLSKNGIYIIEDVTTDALVKWETEAPIMQTYYPYLHFCTVHLPLETNTESNCLIVIQRTEKVMVQEVNKCIKDNIGWSNYPTELCNILNKYGTDKAVFSDHSYSRLYSRLFHELRYLPIRYFEVGIGTINPQIEVHH